MHQHLKTLLVALTLILTLGALSPTASATPDPPLDAYGFPVMDTEGLVVHETERFVVYAVPDAEAGAKNITARAETSLAHIQRAINSEDPHKIRVVILADFADYFKRRGMRSRAPRWAIGLAISSESTILLRHGQGEDGPLVDLDKTFTHELAHIALDRKVGQAQTHIHGHERFDQNAAAAPMKDDKRRVPRWFHEGFAIRMAGEWDLERSTVLMQGGLGGKAISLHQLRERFPAAGFPVELAYAESHHFLLYLEDRFGQRTGKLLDEMASGKTFEDAFFATYHVEFSKVESEWFEALNVRYTWIPVILGSSTLWFFGGLLFVFAYIRRRRQQKERMATMDDDSPKAAPRPIPLPGLGMAERHARGSSHRVLSDGTVLIDVPGKEHLVYFSPDHRDLEMEMDGEEMLPRTEEGYTLH